MSNFSFTHTVFHLFRETFLVYLSNLKLSSADCFNLDQSKILSSGNGLMSTTVFVYRKWRKLRIEFINIGATRCENSYTIKNQSATTCLFFYLIFLGKTQFAEKKEKMLETIISPFPSMFVFCILLYLTHYHTMPHFEALTIYSFIYNIVGKGELLATNNFSFPHNVFYPIWHLFFILI